MEPEKENEVVQTEEPVKIPTLNKNGRPRKELTEEAKIKLAKAREKANAIRAQNSAKKLQSKANEKNDKAKEVLEPKQNVVPLNTLDEIEEEVEEIVKQKQKAKPKKKTKIIVEQSSDDTDEFEPNDNVVFVKRVSRKKKEPVRPPTPPPTPVQYQMERPPIEPPEPPPKPKPTAQQLQNQRNYEAMFSGSFLNNPRRRHY